MTNILDKIVANKKLEVARQIEEISISALEIEIDNLQYKGQFKDSLLNSDTGIISEFKRRSPSRDWIFKDAKVEEIIPAYSGGGASAISVLTDYDFFGGSFDDIRLARSLTKTPILRKDFMIDEYQIYQAAAMGVDAILLIASCLTEGEVKVLAHRAKTLGLDTLLEIHNEKELSHINEYIDVVGVNNRNLGTFETNIKASFDLAAKIPDNFVKISESGISSTETVRELQAVGYQGFLMGENFMKTDNPGFALKNFIKELQ